MCYHYQKNKVLVIETLLFAIVLIDRQILLAYGIIFHVLVGLLQVEPGKSFNTH